MGGGHHKAVFLIRRLGLELACDPALAYNEHPVANAAKLRKLGTCHYYGHAPLFRKTLKKIQYQLLRAYIYAAGRLGYQQQLRLLCQRPGDAHLLLVSAGKGACVLRCGGAADIKILYHLVRVRPYALLISQLYWAILLEELALGFHGRKSDIQIDRAVEEQSYALSVLAHKGYVGLERVPGVVEAQLPALEYE